MKKTYLNLNFLPEEFVKEKKDYYPYLIGGLAAAAVLLFLLTGIVTWYKERHALAKVEARTSLSRARPQGYWKRRRNSISCRTTGAC